MGRRLGALAFFILTAACLFGCRPKAFSGEETSSETELREETEDMDSLSASFLVTEEESEEETEREASVSSEPTKEEKHEAPVKPAVSVPAAVTPAPPKAVWRALVNKRLNYVVIYKDEIPVKAFVCSVGETTPLGTFRTSDKYTWRALFGDVWGQYATRIVNNILFHSVPYLKAMPDTLETEEYNKLGSTASAGCVRMTVEGCKWIFDNCPRGMEVKIVEEDLPSPIGVQGAVKIPLSCTWDPTDPKAPLGLLVPEIPETQETTEASGAEEENSSEPTTVTEPESPEETETTPSLLPTESEEPETE